MDGDNYSSEDEVESLEDPLSQEPLSQEPSGDVKHNAIEIDLTEHTAKEKKSEEKALELPRFATRAYQLEMLEKSMQRNIIVTVRESWLYS